MSYHWALPALLAWLAVLLAPWRPWRTDERLEADARRAGETLGDVAVLIPARNEAATLPATLASLAAQGPGLEILVVDDQSDDDTARVVRDAALSGVRLIRGEPLPPGWSGKVWAQAQGARHLRRPLTLLLDADVALAPGLVATLRAELERERRDLVSLMATLPMRGFWERLLLPPFVFFFKLLYPFRLAAAPRSRVAAAAGGCILLRTPVLESIGGFAALGDALIDDCALARLAKRAGHRTWVGLSRSVTSHRRYARLADVWRMVARSAFTQLGCSWWWLASCTVAMLVCFASPAAVLVAGDASARAVAAAALAASFTAYLPTLRFYDVPSPWVLGLPLAGVLFLAMTWDSALGYARGRRAAWRGRRYARRTGDDASMTLGSPR
ncbi:MAG: glycosyltransferase [Gammaproteobacteria bacterium]|nr:glycosyltransferase [Gammaproteobacteria bacterium]